MATFADLPHELRIRIWEFTIEPRTVRVQFKYEQHYSASKPRLISDTPVPATLQVCQEARQHSLYQKVFSEIVTHDRGPQYVWVSLEIDIVDIGKSYLSHFTSVAATIRRLKLEREMSATAFGEFFFHTENQELRNFTRAEEVYVVCADGLFSWIGAFESGFFWPCDHKNVFFINLHDNAQTFRGEEGLDRISEMDDLN